MIQKVLLCLIGLAGGILVAAGLFTFLAIAGVPPRLMAVTHTSAYGLWYEWMLIAGGILGNVIWVAEPAWGLGNWAAGLAGIFIGLFIGCLIGAIAEVLNAFPVFLRRGRIKKGIALIIMGMALGKGVGAWLWYFRL